MLVNVEPYNCEWDIKQLNIMVFSFFTLLKVKTVIIIYGYITVCVKVFFESSVNLK